MLLKHTILAVAMASLSSVALASVTFTSPNAKSVPASNTTIAPTPSVKATAVAASSVAAVPASTSASTPTVVATPVSPATGTPTKVDNTPEPVNPFVGKPLSLENRQRELELSKMETSLLEERIKQVSLMEDMKTMPLKKQVEAAQATTARMKEEATQREASRPASANIPASAASIGATGAPATPVKKVKPVVTKPVEAKPAETPAPASIKAAPKFEVTSISNIGGSLSAVLEIDGNILPVKHGETTALGRVEIMDSQTVRIAGQVLKLHSATLSRLTLSDLKPVDTRAGAGIATTSTVSPAAIAQQGGLMTYPNPGQANKSNVPTLPPLQLPAGVTLLPAGGTNTGSR